MISSRRSIQVARVAFSPPNTVYLKMRGQPRVARTSCSHQQKASSEGTPTTAPTVTYRGKALQARHGEILRRVLLRSRCHPHNGGLLITCKGIGTCGTCAVAVQGRVEPPEPGWRERSRLSFPPHTKEKSEQKRLRLACQVRVSGDITVDKYDGFWGHGATQLDDIAMS